ncbi:MAG: hypothetical protein ABI852_12795 [Gemmatimonadaceae bacterium]
MYATCTFCHGALGRNESIEVFPVGRRLAYDASKGRLWVVCPLCAQWNLSPLEERWEAIESAERLFRASRLRHSTDNIGLAKLSDSTELIRIGSPLRPEMAAWRYGQNFVRRWRSTATSVGVGAVVLGSVAFFLPGMGSVAAATALAVAGSATAGLAGRQALRRGGKVALLGQFIRDNEQQYVRVSNKELSLIRLVSHESGWALRVPYESRRPTVQTSWRDYVEMGGIGSVTLSGQTAVTAARQLLPIINGWGARSSVVNDAVILASTWESSHAAFVDSMNRSRVAASTQLFGDVGSLYHLPATVRLGLEMTLHDAEEQRALDGELAELERVWREAESIAGISDGMFMPGRVERLMKQLRGRNPLA